MKYYGDVTGSYGALSVFSERYGQLRMLHDGVAETPVPVVSERVVQCIWYDGLFSREGCRQRSADRRGRQGRRT